MPRDEAGRGGRAGISVLFLRHAAVMHSRTTWPSSRGDYVRFLSRGKSLRLHRLGKLMELVHASSYSDRSRDGARKQAAIFPFFPFRFTHYLTCDLFGGGRKVLTAKLNREIVGMVVERVEKAGGVPGGRVFQRFGRVLFPWSR